MVCSKHPSAEEDDGEEGRVRGAAQQEAREGPSAAGRPGGRLLPFVVLATFLAWSLRVAFLNYEGLADLTVHGLLNEALRVAIFVGPVLLYLRYVQRAPALAFLKMNAAPGRNAAWLLPLLGALLVGWFLLLERMIGDGRIGGATAAVVAFTVFSPATLVEEIYFRGFLLNKLRQTAGFWRANLASSVLFGLIHFPGWLALGRFAAPPSVAVDFVGLVAFGMLFGWAMYKTGSLWSAYALHALYDLLVVLVLSP